MVTITNFHYEAENVFTCSHIMMYVKEFEAYFHIWDIENNPVVKMNVTGTRRQVKVTSKKKTAELIAAAKKML